jgi:hypothetical protein
MTGGCARRVIAWRCASAEITAGDVRKKLGCAPILERSGHAAGG